MAVRIAVPGEFRLTGDVVDFVYGDQTIRFSDIKDMAQLRAVLMNIFHGEMERACASIVKDGAETPGIVNPLQEVMKEQERSFRQFQQETEAALQQAKAAYANSTAPTQ